MILGQTLLIRAAHFVKDDEQTTNDNRRVSRHKAETSFGVLPKNRSAYGGDICFTAHSKTKAVSAGMQFNLVIFRTVEEKNYLWCQSFYR